MLYKVTNEVREFWISYKKEGLYINIGSIKKELSGIIKGTVFLRKKIKDNYGCNYNYFYKNLIFYVNENKKLIYRIEVADKPIKSSKYLERNIEICKNNLKNLYFLELDIVEKYRKLTGSTSALPIIKRQLTAMVHACKSNMSNNYFNSNEKKLYIFDNLLITVNDVSSKIIDISITSEIPKNQNKLNRDYMAIGKSLGLNDNLDNFRNYPQNIKYCS